MGVAMLCPRMTGIYILISILAYLFVALTLIMAVGYRGLGAEQKRHEEAVAGNRSLVPGVSDARAAEARSEPDFRSSSSGDEFLQRVERFLRTERAIAERFVRRPSPDMLFRDGKKGLTA